MTIQPEELKKQLEARFPDAKLRVIAGSILIEDPKDLTRVAFFLKEAPEFRMDYLSSVTGADYLDYLESVYHFYSMEKKTGPVVLRVRVKPDNAKIPSLVPVYAGAEYQEREAYDTFGIIYEGHPDLRRLFMWEGFDGYPLRKSYRQEDADVLEKQDIEWLEARGVNVPQKFKAQAEELAAAGKKALAEKPLQPRIG
jgi:NADH:ubiquinone oxidoreductase subunit C